MAVNRPRPSGQSRRRIAKVGRYRAQTGQVDATRQNGRPPVVGPILTVLARVVGGRLISDRSSCDISNYRTGLSEVDWGSAILASCRSPQSQGGPQVAQTAIVLAEEEESRAGEPFDRAAEFTSGRVSHRPGRGRLRRPLRGCGNGKWRPGAWPRQAVRQPPWCRRERRPPAGRWDRCGFRCRAN